MPNCPNRQRAALQSSLSRVSGASSSQCPVSDVSRPRFQTYVAEVHLPMAHIRATHRRDRPPRATHLQLRTALERELLVRIVSRTYWRQILEDGEQLASSACLLTHFRQQGFTVWTDLKHSPISLAFPTRHKTNIFINNIRPAFEMHA